MVTSVKVGGVSSPLSKKDGGTGGGVALVTSSTTSPIHVFNFAHIFFEDLLLSNLIDKKDFPIKKPNKKFEVDP